MVARFRQVYGASPLHLLALVASVLIAAAAVVGWFQSFPGPTAVRVLAWFLGAIVVHDLVLLPLYSLLDRIAFGSRRARRSPRSTESVSGIAYVRVPALLSGLLFLVFFPEILRVTAYMKLEIARMRHVGDSVNERILSRLRLCQCIDSVA